MPTTWYSRQVGERDEAMIAAEVVAADALNDRLKVIASDRRRSRLAGCFIAMSPWPG